jgi:dipeptidyl aminopeptidase/acylaminoacyl peptidase
MPNRKSLLLVALIFLNLQLIPVLSAASKPPITLDEFFNAVEINSVKLSPDGRSVVIATERADWNQEIFRKDLWLYKDNGDPGSSLVQLTQSGHDSDAEWSPDGHWIAFLSDRKPAAEDKAETEHKDSSSKPVAHVYLISADGGEAFPITSGEEEVHAFAWSPDSRNVYIATRTPWSKKQKDAYKKEWNDVNQYREAERGDVIATINLGDALARHVSEDTRQPKNLETQISETGATPGSHQVASTTYAVDYLVVSPDGRRLAFNTVPVSRRLEGVEAYELYVVDLIDAGSPHVARQLTHNQALEQEPHWAPDSRHLFFRVDLGSVERKYQDTQSRVYSIDVDTGQAQQWASSFGGPVSPYAVTAQGGLLAPARLGTQVQIYSQTTPTGSFEKKPGWPGIYDSISTAKHSPRVAVVYSSLQRPTEVYLAESADQLEQARPITAFNKLFTERELPQGKAYRWNADDGTSVEGMLIYPPGQFGAKHLRMLTLIHGGPADADGDHFEADWYQWSALAATSGWLVFQPNYRGSSGYGDKFLHEIVPHLVSRPGKDILEGVDALVKDGIADPQHLAIGGYSYGGYMTNWLITQTTRFRAAVTGAGAVEHAANWGNDDLTLDDAFYLGGNPWEAPQMYNDEAALFQMNKVKTPTHVVAGAEDNRVAVSEDYLLEHALHALGVPSTLLIFPGENHPLNKNPWHGKIKVREELKWINKYDGTGAPANKAVGQ